MRSVSVEEAVAMIPNGPKAQQQMLAKQIVIDLVPQGTLIDRIRAGGCGLGGVLTPTGVGTIVEEGKQKVQLGGKTFLLEAALRADFALIHVMHSLPISG